MNNKISSDVNGWLRRHSKSIIIGALCVVAVAAIGNYIVNASYQERHNILNVSYDPTRELYTDYNQKFGTYWENTTGETLEFSQSNGGSGKQARAVMEGLDADVLSLALAYDVDKVANTGLINQEWRDRFPNQSVPYTSLVVFLVRKDNPKHIQDWNDLAHDDVSIVVPNPKTSGAARWIYLSVWAYGRERYQGNEADIKTFIKSVYGHVKVLDSGSRDSTTSFVNRKQGDVLIGWENEALLIMHDYPGEYEMIIPSITMRTDLPVVVVDEVVDRKHTRDIAQGYIQYLYSDEGQRVIAEHNYRPINQDILKEYNQKFKPANTVTIDSFGGWSAAQQVHFSEGGTFDEIYEL